jgi:isoquinoline 1-oxidoreductase subunit beta
VPVGFWRSVAHTYTAFAMECFMDTLAHAAGQDPVRFRLALLKRHPRHAAVLERLARESGWGTPLAPGQARGLALHEAMGSIVGEVAQVSLQGRALRVQRVVAVVDCGLLVNPVTAEAQIQGGIVFGLTAALHGEINIRAGAVRQGNFGDYRLLRMAQMPAIEVHFMRNGEPHGGLGEPGVPPIAPAVANALFALTGQRVQTLPLSKLGYAAA